MMVGFGRIKGKMQRYKKRSKEGQCMLKFAIFEP